MFKLLGNDDRVDEYMEKQLKNLADEQLIHQGNGWLKTTGDQSKNSSTASEECLEKNYLIDVESSGKEFHKSYFTSHPP